MRTAGEIAGIISALGQEDGLLVGADQFVWTNRRVIIELSARYQIPAIYPWPTYVREGGLMAYSVDNAALSRGAAQYVDQLLRGAKVGELPIQQPTTFAFDVNLEAAKALGLSVPRELLVQ